MREPENILQVDKLGTVDWMGFIFFQPSSRNVAEVPTYLPQQCKRVGVFVNAEIADITDKVRAFGFEIVQLHGDESTEYCRQLKSVLGDNIKMIKTVQISSESDIIRTAEYESIIDYFIFETKCSSYGGSGKQFDWDILEHYNGSIPFLITGGICAEDVQKVQNFRHPQFAGIDLNSRFEVSPALKNITILKDFVSKVKSF